MQSQTFKHEILFNYQQLITGDRSKVRYQSYQNEEDDE